MSAPALARADELGRRFYQDRDGNTYWSVTTIINGGVPKYLGPWHGKMAALAALDAILERGPSSRSSAIIRRLAGYGRDDILARQARGELTSIKLAKLTDRDLARRWISGAADRYREAAADKGSSVHQEAEELVIAHAREDSRLTLEGVALKPWPAELAKYQAAFTKWVGDFHPEFLAAEATVFNATQAWAGTLDCICILTLPDGRTLVVIIDYKSGANVYAEVALQLSAYSRGEWIELAGGVRMELPKIDAGAVLHLRASGSYRFRLVRIDEPVYQAFLFAREVFRFNEEMARTVFLQDLTVANPEAML